MERGIDNRIWMDEDFWDLDKDAKLLLLGIMTHVNDLGEMRAHDVYIANTIMIGINPDPSSTAEMLTQLLRFGFIEYFTKEDERRWLRLNSKWLGKRTSHTPIEAYGGLHVWDELRREAKIRDGQTCTRCGTREGRIIAHHIVPLASGGPNTVDNLTTLCQSCHRITHAKRGDF